MSIVENELKKQLEGMLDKVTKEAQRLTDLSVNLGKIMTCLEDPPKPDIAATLTMKVKHGKGWRRVPKRCKGETWKVIRDYLSTGLCTVEDIMGVAGINKGSVNYHLKRHRSAIVSKYNEDGKETYTLRGI
jgi:hypothetical protein